MMRSARRGRPNGTVAPDCAAVALMLADRMDGLAAEILGKPTNRNATEWRFGRKGSLQVTVAGPWRGRWRNHELGQGGDALALVDHVRGGGMAGARRWSLAWLGIDASGPPSRTPLVHEPRTAASSSGKEDRRKAWLRRKADRLWADGAAPEATLVETYLRSRGLHLPQGVDVLRFHFNAWRNAAKGPQGPAMLARMTCPLTGEPIGTHVTYLRADGRGKADGDGQRIVLGRAGVVRLVADEEVTMGLGIAEGIETALSVAQRYGWSPVWAATSAGGIGSFPVLAGIGDLTVFADQDAAGVAAANACALRWQEAGASVTIRSPAEGDFNDVLLKAGA